MDFCVKGITFTKDELKEQNLSELKIGEVSKSHLFYYMPQTEKVFLLLRAGELIQKDFIEKYLNKDMKSCYCLEVAKKDDITSYRELWGKLKTARIEEEKLYARDLLLEEFKKDYWNKSEKSFLTFVISAFEEFYFFPESIISEFYNKSTILYTRAINVSAISLVTALCSEYCDYKFLKDLYNTCFLNDYGLLKGKDLNYNILRACEVERTKQGSGLNYLAALNFDDYKVFKDHPTKSYEECLKYESYFSSPEIISLILLHHEKSDGEGFPNGYFRNVLSDSDTLIAFSDNFVPFTENFFFIGDSQKLIVENFQKLKEYKDQYNIYRHLSFWDMAMTKTANLERENV